MVEIETSNQFAFEGEEEVFDKRSQRSTGTDKPAKAPWVDLFEHNRAPERGFQLENIPCDGDVCEFDATDENGYCRKGYCLLGFFAGRFPGKPALKALCGKWNVKYL